MEQIELEIEDELIMVDDELGAEDDVVVDAFGFTEEQEQEIADELVMWVEQQEVDGAQERENWITWRRQLDAVPKMKAKNYPIVNASNASPPLAQIHGQTMTANIINYFNYDPFFGVDALQDSDEARLDAALLTKYLDMLAQSPNDLNLRAKVRTIAEQIGVMGRCVSKVPFTENSWRYKKEDETGVAQTVTVTQHLGPEIVPIPQEDIYYPKEWNDVEYMPKIVHMLHLPEHVVRARMEDGTYVKHEEVLERGERNTSAKHEREMDHQSGHGKAERTGVFDLLEAYFYWDADGDGYYEDYIWVIDRATRKVLRKEYNTMGRRPFTFGFYIKRSHELSGKGTGHICAPLQEEVEAIHNIRNDNMKIANMRMIEMKRSVMMSNTEELSPGKIWLTETGNDIRTLQLGEIYPSSMNEEQHLWQLSSQATGQSEVQRGFADPTLGQRDTYKGQSMRMNAAKGIFGTICDGAKEMFNDMGMLILYQLVCYADQVVARERMLKRLKDEEITRLERLLSVDKHELPGKFAFRVNTVDMAKSPQGKMQSMQMLGQMFAMYGQQVSPLADKLLGPEGMQMQQQSPAIWEFYMSLLVGSTKFLKETMKLSGLDDPETYVMNTDVFEGMLKVMEDQNKEQAKQLEAVYGARGFSSEGQGGGAGQGAEGDVGAGAVGGMAVSPEGFGSALGGSQGGAGGGSGAEQDLSGAGQMPGSY